MITTIFDSSQEIVTSLQILKEFITSYISTDEIDYLSSRPTLNEGTDSLSKPIFYTEVLPGRDKECGLGRRISDTYRGKFHDVAIMFFIVVTEDIGGSERARQLVDQIRWSFLTRGFELEQAGLVNPLISSMRELTKENYGPFFGARMMITFQTTIVYA